MQFKHLVLGVHVTDRVRRAADVQQLLSEYGCNIKTRLGVHEVTDEFCAESGLILLEMWGDYAKCMELRDKLGRIEGVEIQQMEFSHPAS